MLLLNYRLSVRRYILSDVRQKQWRGGSGVSVVSGSTKAWECVHLSANRFLIEWENGIQISFLFFVFLRPIFRFSFTRDIEKRIGFLYVFATLWKTDLNFRFCFSFSPHFEKEIWISVFVFRFSPHFEKRNWLSFFVFASLWKTYGIPMRVP